MLRNGSIKNPGIELRLAAAMGNIDRVKVFLDKKFINKQSSNGNTALHWSIENKHYKVTKLLLAMPDIHVDASNQRGHTPLHIAVKQGDKRTVYRLLKQGAGHKNCIDNDGFSPLDYAFEKSCSFIVTKLKHRLPKMTFKNADKLAEQAYEKFKTKNPILIRNFQIFDPDYLFNKKLIPYFLPGNLFTLVALKKAIDKGILNPHKLFSSGNLLQSASVSRVDTLEKFRWLLEQGVDPNLQASHEINPSSYKNTALHTLIANEAENEAIALINLLKHNKKSFNFNLTDSEEKTCLCLAVKVGLSKVAMQLIALKDSVDVNIPDEDGNTPLHYAFLLGHESIAIELMKNQSNKNAKNKENQTPYELLNATDIEDVRDCLETIWINPDRKVKQLKKTYSQQCMENRQIIAKKYIDQEIFTAKKRKNIAFLVAAATGDLSKIQENCDDFTLNACNANGNTALHLACEHNHDEIVKFLLKQPAIDLNKKNNENKKAADLLSHSVFATFKEKLFAKLELSTEDTLSRFNQRIETLSNETKPTLNL
ncbi:MAG: ankyrin repeat domain-containing protein [Candidatus Aquirickettsiella sp.]